MPGWASVLPLHQHLGGAVLAPLKPQAQRSLLCVAHVTDSSTLEGLSVTSAPLPITSSDLQP